MPLDNAEYLPPSVQILMGADRLLAGPKNWVKDALSNKDKTAFCIFGAVLESSRRLGFERSPNYLDASRRVEDLAIERGYGMQCQFNNAAKTTFSDIKALLQEAIELESAKVAA